MHETVEIRLTVNRRPRDLRIEPRETIAEVVRERLSLTGTKISCDAQVCGACTLLVDGLAVSGCTYLAVDADGRDVETVEGLAQGTALSPLQQAFIDHAAFQCGYCTPGMLMAATALLRDNPSPTHEEVAEGLDGNLCRCTGYAPIIDAVLDAARVMRGEPAVGAGFTTSGPAGLPGAMPREVAE